MVGVNIICSINFEIIYVLIVHTYMTIVYIINNLATSTMSVNIVSTQEYAIPTEVQKLVIIECLYILICHVT